MTSPDFHTNNRDGKNVTLRGDVHQRLTIYCLRNAMVVRTCVSMAMDEWLKKREKSGE